MPGENEYEDDFAANIASEIGESLFPAAEPEGEASAPAAEPPIPGSVEPKGAPPPASESVTPPATPGVTPGQNSVAKALPKSWKKDMAPHWEKLPPEVHEYVYAREADVMRGIQQYQSGYQQWDTLVKPFAPIFQQHPDVNPVQIMQGLMNTHLQLLNPSAPKETKIRMAQKLLADYDIDLSGVPQEPADQRLMAELNTLRSELGQLRQNMTARERAEYNNGVQAQLSAIEAFAADPKNEFFNDAGNDILRLIQTGAATDLASAYDMACWSNPVIRAKMLAKQQAATLPPANPAQRNGKGQFVNLDSPSVPPARTRKPQSMDATIEGIVSSHYSPKH
jgi:hypothetical protein